MGLSHSYYPERKNKPSPFPRIMNNFHNWCCSQLESQQMYYLLSRSLASRLFPLAMQWCKGVLPWKSRVFTSAPNCSNNSSINGLPMSHASCNKEQPWRWFPGSLEVLILSQAAGSGCFVSVASMSRASTWWDKWSPAPPSNVVLMRFMSDITIRRYTSRKSLFSTACQMLVAWEAVAVASLMTSNFSTYCFRVRMSCFIWKVWASFHNTQA